MCAAELNPAYIFLIGTLFNSKIIVPSFTKQTHKNVVPTPLPILEFLPFFVMAKFGKILIQSLLFRPVTREIQRLAASICLNVKKPEEVAFKPKKPKLI